MNALQARVLRTLVHTLGRLSDGVRIARTHGVTSGKSLEYVYRNRPAGIGPLGKLFDRIYLSSRSWRAVRRRKQNLQDQLRWAIGRQLDAFGEALILDIASGQASYLQEVLVDFGDRAVRAICWDIDDAWLREGRTTAARLGLTNILYDGGDAFDPACFERLPWRPNVIVASGLYDWMQSDADVRRSMALAHDAMPVGGALLFTALTGHNDLAVVNAVFPGFDGQPLKVRNRPASQVHDWVKRAGFGIAKAAADQWGFYTVTAAVRA